MNWLRSRPWGIRLLSIVGLIIFIPLYLWLSRDEINFGYAVLWRGLKTGGRA